MTRFGIFEDSTEREALDNALRYLRQAATVFDMLATNDLTPDRGAEVRKTADFYREKADAIENSVRA